MAGTIGQAILQEEKEKEKEKELELELESKRQRKIGKCFVFIRATLREAIE